MSRSTIILGLLIMCGAAYLASKVFAPTPTVKPVVRVPVVTRTEPVERVVRERPAPVAPVAKVAAVQDAQQKRFTELREEGRQIRQMLAETEPLSGQAYQNAGQRQDYQALVARRRLLETNWNNATEAERQSIINETNSIREATIAIVLTELATLKNAPRVQPAPANGAPTTLTRGASTQQAAPPPPPPIIYM